MDFNDPQKFQKAVQLSDIHLDKGLQCVDCHFEQDSTEMAACMANRARPWRSIASIATAPSRRALR